MWHMHFLRKRVIRQMSSANRNDMSMLKINLIYLINLNWHIYTSLDLVISRVKSSKKSEAVLQRCFYEKVFWNLLNIFWTPFPKKIYGGLLLKVKSDSIKIILSSTKRNTTLNELNIFNVIATDALKTSNKYWPRNHLGKRSHDLGHSVSHRKPLLCQFADRSF